MSTIEDFLNGPYGWLSIFFVIVLFTLITIIFYYRTDKYDPEPINRIVLAFFYGIISVIPALVLSVIAGVILAEFFAFSIIALSILVAPPVEEISKGWFVIRLSQSDEFDGPLDGLIYGAMVGAGFAAAENLLYGLSALLSEESLFAGLFVATLRSVTQIIGHPFYTGLFGVGVGEAKVGLSNDKYKRIWQSIILHAAWNTMSGLADVFFIIGILVMVGISIYILRKELKRALDLDKDAFDRGYYDQKRRFLEERRQRIKQQIRAGPNQWQHRPSWQVRTNQPPEWQQRPSWQIRTNRQPEWGQHPQDEWQQLSSQPTDQIRKSQSKPSEESDDDTRSTWNEDKKSDDSENQS